MKTESKLVFPQAPSPIMTSFLSRESIRIHHRRLICHPPSHDLGILLRHFWLELLDSLAALSGRECSPGEVGLLCGLLFKCFSGATNSCPSRRKLSGVACGGLPVVSNLRFCCNSVSRRTQLARCSKEQFEVTEQRRQCKDGGEVGAAVTPCDVVSERCCSDKARSGSMLLTRRVGGVQFGNTGS